MNYKLFSSDSESYHVHADLENYLMCSCPDEISIEMNNRTYAVVYDAIEVAKKLKAEGANVSHIVVPFLDFEAFEGVFEVEGDIEGGEDEEVEKKVSRKVYEQSLYVDISDLSFRFKCTWGDANDILFTRSFSDISDLYLPF